MCNWGVGSATLTALSAQNLTSNGSVIVSGNVTPYNLTSGDSLSAALLEVGGSLSYAGTSNAGQLKLSVQSGFNLGAGAASASEEPESYATGMDFYGAPLSPTTDNAVAGNGGSLTINTGSANGTGDFTVGDFTGNGNSTYLSFNGGNLMSTAGNTGFGGNGGSFTVNSVGNVTVNPNVFFYGYGGDFRNEATVTGTGTPTGGNGGTFALTAAGSITINNPSEFDLYGGNVGNGGDNVATGTAGNGGTFSLSGAAGITINSGTGEEATNIDVRGGGAEAAGTSGNGGTISLVSAAGPITVGPGAHLATDGGAVAGASGTAGHGGTVTVQAAGDIALGNTDFELGEDGLSAVKRPGASATLGRNSTFLTADGGTADQTGLVGGNGGKITISSTSTDSSQPVIAIGTALISATTGGNSMTTFGGTGGTINLTASGVPAASPGGTPSGQYQIALDNTAVVASDDNTVTANTSNSHSQVGGTINVTSASTTGLGILIQDNSNLVALVNSASTGTGGKINLLSSGGEIDVYGSSLTASGSEGKVVLQTLFPTSDGSVTSINLAEATVSSDFIAILTAGQNDQVNITSGSTLTAGSSLEITSPNITVSGNGTSQITTLKTTDGDLTLQTSDSSETPPTAGGITINPDSSLQEGGANLTLLATGTNGVITLGSTSNNALSTPDPTALSADMLKIRAMGANGSIVINAGSTLSATTQLLLYADGSNGSITFQGGNITLSTGSLAGILASPTITIKTGTTVTVNGSAPILVYTDHANYSDDYGGNDSQVGGFAGTAQPSGTPQPFSSAPAFPGGSGNAMKVAANAAVPTTTVAGSVPTVSTTKGSKAKTAGATGTVIRPTMMRAAGPSIPFSALNPQDLSYDPRLLQGGPKTAAVASKRGKAGTGLPAGDVAAGREKLRAATERTEAGPRKPDATVRPSAFRPSR